MVNLLRMSPDELHGYHAQVRARYDQFAARGVKLNLTRGKPSAQQLDLSNELLGLPGNHDFMCGAVDCRNYGELQGLPELRALLAPVFGVTPDRVILGENASLSLMHDAVAFSLLKGNCDSERPWHHEPRIAFLCPVPGYDRHSSSARSSASR